MSKSNIFDERTVNLFGLDSDGFGAYDYFGDQVPKNPFLARGEVSGHVNSVASMLHCGFANFVSEV